VQGRVGLRVYRMASTVAHMCLVFVHNSVVCAQGVIYEKQQQLQKHQCSLLEVMRRLVRTQ
jgi:hypothetical protein